MQTFLPLDNPFDSAVCLDRQRLGKQRVECLQILRAIKKGSGGWCNHPAVKMWRGYTPALVYYASIICFTWQQRGYEENTFPKIMEEFPLESDAVYMHSNLEIKVVECPPFIGDAEFHDSHKSNLLRKDPEFYGQYNWDVPNDLPYVWPETDRLDMPYQDSIARLLSMYKEIGLSYANG
jgi:hypothetical protein